MLNMMFQSRHRYIPLNHSTEGKDPLASRVASCSSIVTVISSLVFAVILLGAGFFVGSWNARRFLQQNIERKRAIGNNCFKNTDVCDSKNSATSVRIQPDIWRSSIPYIQRCLETTFPGARRLLQASYFSTTARRLLCLSPATLSCSYRYSSSPSPSSSPCLQIIVF